jgi:DNA-binding response OmpR family regulator
MAPPAVAAGSLRIDIARRRVTARDGSAIALTRKEFELLAALSHQPGVVVSRERLFIEVWKNPWPGARRTLDVHMATLRAKLGDPNVIQTVHGVGYRLVTDDDGDPAGTAGHVSDARGASAESAAARTRLAGGETNKAAP